MCNLAAQAGVRYSIDNPHAYINSNIVGFLNILEACRHNNIKHLVYASSSSVYGPWGRPDMAPILFADAITNNRPIKVFNKGKLERDFTYIDDIVEGVSRIINNPPYNKNNSPFSPLLWGDASVRHKGERQRGSVEYPAKSQKGGKNDAASTSSHIDNLKTSHNLSTIVPYKIYNIGKGTPIKLLDFIETMEKALNKKAEKQYLPMQAGDVYKTFADVSELKKNFGYSPNTSLEKGIREFVDWYKSYYQTQRYL